MPSSQVRRLRLRETKQLASGRAVSSGQAPGGRGLELWHPQGRLCVHFTHLTKWGTLLGSFGSGFGRGAQDSDEDNLRL